MLARIYGIFAIKTAGLCTIHLIIMQNTSVLYKQQNKLLEFDLKGSLHNRKTQFNMKKMNKKMERNKTLKDLNFLEI